MEPTCGLTAPSPDVPRDAAACVNRPAALEKFVSSLQLDVVPFLCGAFFKAGTLGLWAGSLNLRMRSRTELERVNVSNTLSFFAGAVNVMQERALNHTQEGERALT